MMGQQASRPARDGAGAPPSLTQPAVANHRPAACRRQAHRPNASGGERLLGARANHTCSYAWNLSARPSWPYSSLTLATDAASCLP